MLQAIGGRGARFEGRPTLIAQGRAPGPARIEAFDGSTSVCSRDQKSICPLILNVRPGKALVGRRNELTPTVVNDVLKAEMYEVLVAL
jgi:hypothetical protein